MEKKESKTPIHEMGSHHLMCKRTQAKPSKYKASPYFSQQEPSVPISTHKPPAQPYHRYSPMKHGSKCHTRTISLPAVYIGAKDIDKTLALDNKRNTETRVKSPHQYIKRRSASLHLPLVVSDGYRPQKQVGSSLAIGLPSPLKVSRRPLLPSVYSSEDALLQEIKRKNFELKMKDAKIQILLSENKVKPERRHCSWKSI